VTSDIRLARISEIKGVCLVFLSFFEKLFLEHVELSAVRVIIRTSKVTVLNRAVCCKGLIRRGVLIVLLIISYDVLALNNRVILYYHFAFFIREVPINFFIRRVFRSFELVHQALLSEGVCAFVDKLVIGIDIRIKFLC
jgi:hypothetical protein